MYHKSMMPGTKWNEGRKSSFDVSVYRTSRKPGKILPMEGCSNFVLTNVFNIVLRQMLARLRKDDGK